MNGLMTGLMFLTIGFFGLFWATSLCETETKRGPFAKAMTTTAAISLTIGLAILLPNLTQWRQILGQVFLVWGAISFIFLLSLIPFITSMPLRGKTLTWTHKSFLCLSFVATGIGFLILI